MHRFHFYVYTILLFISTFQPSRSQGNDIPSALVLDNARNIFVAGSSMDQSGTMDLIILGYGPNGNLEGSQINKPAVSGSGIARGITISGNNVLFTGMIPDATGKYVIITGSYPRSSLVGVEHLSSAPADFTLEQSYPNPLSNEQQVATITYSLNRSSFVRLAVVDGTGKTVSELVNEQKNAGTYQTTFNPSALPSGTYYYTLQSRSGSITKKIVVMR